MYKKAYGLNFGFEVGRLWLWGGKSLWSWKGLRRLLMRHWRTEKKLPLKGGRKDDPSFWLPITKSLAEGWYYGKLQTYVINLWLELYALYPTQQLCKNGIYIPITKMWKFKLKASFSQYHTAGKWKSHTFYTKWLRGFSGRVRRISEFLLATYEKWVDRGELEKKLLTFGAESKRNIV